MNPETIANEAAYADAEYTRWNTTAVNPAMFARYQHPHQMWDWRQRAASLLGDLRGKTVFDMGCGQGEESTYFALLGARVISRDVSEVGIEQLKRRAALAGVTVDARIGSVVPQSDLAPESVDVVHGMGILHHVGLGVGLAEARRVLRPGGVAVFLEPMGDVRWVEEVKARLTQTRFAAGRGVITEATDGEENLRFADVDSEAAKWSAATIYPYHLTYRARKLFLPPSLRHLTARFDYAVLRAMPWLRRFAGAVVMRLVKSPA